MINILISKTDPYSFMGLMKSSEMKRPMRASFRCLINAGFMSLFLIALIMRMVPDRSEANQTEKILNANLNMDASVTTCSSETCKLV